MSDDSLNLGVNDAYRDAINHASQRTGMPPESIAAVINAEAARGPKGKWKADSYNKKSKAQGLTQFIPSTWLMMANTPGTELNSQTAGMSNQQILALRTDPQLSITTAAEYDSGTLSKLQDDGLVSKNLTPTEKAQYAYLGHHEGLGGASTILKGTLTDKRARKLLPIQVGKKQAKKLIAAAGGDASKAYTDWLNGYIQKKIQPDQFKGTDDPPQLRGTLPSTDTSSAVGGPRIQNGEASVLLGVDQWMAAHVQSPHQAGGQVAQGSNTVFVGPDKLPFARKGDPTTDNRFVWGDTQPDIFIGGVPSSLRGTIDPNAKPTPWWGSLPDPSVFGK